MTEPVRGNPVEDIESVHIPDLNFADYNPRSISQSELRKLAESIEEFGFVEPVIVNRRTEATGWSKDDHPTIVGGHQRVRAAIALGYTHVPVVYVELRETQEKVLNIALNKIGGDWDGALLAAVLTEIEEADDLDVTLTGFDKHEIDRLIEANDVTPPMNFPDVGGVPGDITTQHTCPSCGYEF